MGRAVSRNFLRQKFVLPVKKARDTAGEWSFPDDTKPLCPPTWNPPGHLGAPRPRHNLAFISQSPKRAPAVTNGTFVAKDYTSIRSATDTVATGHGRSFFTSHRVPGNDNAKHVGCKIFIPRPVSAISVNFMIG